MMMSKINFGDIQENYETALTEKVSNKQDVLSAIIDNDLINKFIFIQKDKEKINSIEDLFKYQKDIEIFFNEVYKTITAPGVQKFIDWLDELILKNLETKTRKYITDFLIEEYATYDDNIKNIIANKEVLKPNSSLFENIKKSVKENINKRIVSSFTSNDKVKEEFPDFIEELNDLLEELSSIKELDFVDVKNLYTNNIDEKDSIDWIPEIDVNTDYYYSLIKQVVEKKDFLTTNQDNIQLSTIVVNVQNSIKDINDFTQMIKTIDVSSTSEDDIRTFYNKFESSFKFNNIDNVTDYLQQSITDTWDKIISAYNTCQDFYSNNSQEKISKLESNKNKWSSLEFSSKIELYVLTLKNIISDNPITSIILNDISKIKTNYTKVEKTINSLEENNPKDEIVSFFENIISDFENKKIGILKKLKTDDSIIEKIEGAVVEIQSFIENINNSDNLLNALNDDFVDGVLVSYDYIKKEFTSAIEKSDIKDDLQYLDEISSEEYVLSKTDLEDNIERFKNLLEYDLININLTKNI